MSENSRPKWAMPALALGAIAIGLSPIFVRISEVGPIATAANRTALGLPFFYALVWWQSRRAPQKPAPNRRILLLIAFSGLLFACDLSLWNWSIRLTTVANATVLPNIAPVVVVIGAWLLFREKVSHRFIAGLVMAVAGVFVLMGNSFTISRANFLGDGLAVLTSVFYGGYLLAVSRARREASTFFTMAVGGTTATAVLWVMAAVSEGNVWPSTAHGWLVAVLQALAVQVGGQTLIAASFAYVPAGFGAMVLLLQPIVAAILAWAMFHETLGLWQAVGAAAILVGVEISRRASSFKNPGAPSAD